MDVLLHPISLAIIFILSTARMARFLTYDDFPPMEWLRTKVVGVLPDKWAGVMVCPFCIAPYLVAVNIAWFLALYHHGDTFLWWWLLPNLWWGASYAAAIVVAYDMPEE